MDNLDRLVPVNKLDRLKSAAVKVSASPLDGLSKLAQRDSRLDGLSKLARTIDPIDGLRKVAFGSAQRAFRSGLPDVFNAVMTTLGGRRTRDIAPIADDLIQRMIRSNLLPEVQNADQAIRVLRRPGLRSQLLRSMAAEAVQGSGYAGLTRRQQLQNLHNMGLGGEVRGARTTRGGATVYGRGNNAMVVTPDNQVMNRGQYQRHLEDLADARAARQPIVDVNGNPVRGAGGLTDGMTPEQQTQFIRQQEELARRVMGGGGESGTGATGWLREMSQNHPIGTAAGAVGAGMMANNMMSGGRRGY